MKSIILLSTLTLTALSLPVPDVQVASEANITISTNGTTQTTTSTNLTAAQSQSLSASTSSGINALLAKVGQLPIVGLTVNALSDVIKTAEAALATTLNIDTSEDAANGCTAMTVIFARGTTEPGNVGVLTGPEFFDALTDMLGKNAVSVQGVDYGASIEGFLEGGDPQGSQTMANLITQTFSKCPNTNIVMSGYSQGGQLVHNAANILPAKTMVQVSSVIIFGDPDNGKAVTNVAASKTLVICHAGDNICAGGDLILLPHLTYSHNAEQAATFAAARAGMGLGN
ncbi:hypothetical protein G7Y89_g7964 [Cudoniella acicularis]|uniref:Cutinase n=1 Tax=Cudoniella acicularis TaxID=354080 RepID=A0A8H4W1J3_9HELO|nr:hypothetical protein G7Y89_g7964 [Cudoniella acicularis]